MSGSRDPSITMRVVVTILGNVLDTSQDVQAGSSRAPAHETLSPAALPAQYEQLNLEAKAEADAKNASASFTSASSRLTLRTTQLPKAQVPMAPDAVVGLASILSNLDELIMVINLLPDVSIPSFHLEFGWLSDLLSLLLDSHIG